MASRRTLQRALLLRAILEAPTHEWYGLALAARSGLKSGTVYPALAALEQAGILMSRWEEAEPSEEKRPRRRLYRLVPERANDARAYVAHFDAALAPHRRPGALPPLPRTRPA